ncbi:MAG TPA: hypothetical protein VGO84_00860, partial [Burkholderiales bacterium]|nr:hypothetical protein [Burkholderiales bacterium]
RIRLVILPGMTAWLLLAAGAASAAGENGVPAPLMSAAECMARVVRAMPGVSEVEITVSQAQAGAYPVLAYKFAEPSGLRRYTELSLFEISGIEDAPYVFDRDDIQDDPLAERLLPIWKARCRASFGYITSVPR